MDAQIFINNNPFSRRVSPLPSHHKTLEREFRHCSVQSPPLGHGSIFVRVLMAEVRPYSVTRYKYCRTDGVKRVGFEHPNPPPCESAGVENDDLHCIHSIMVSGGDGGGGGPSELQKAKQRRGEIPLHNCFIADNPQQLTGRSKWVQRGKTKKHQEDLVIGGWLSTHRTWQLSLLAFLAVYAPNFRLGTRVRHPFEKRPESRIKIEAVRKRLCRASPKLRKITPYFIIILQKHFDLNCSME